MLVMKRWLMHTVDRISYQLCQNNKNGGVSMTQDRGPNTGTADVPTQVFEKYLQALSAAELPPHVIARLRKTLLLDKNFTERALKEAILSEEPLP
jgi:hypothetical protein